MKVEKPQMSNWILTKSKAENQLQKLLHLLTESNSEEVHSRSRVTSSPFYLLNYLPFTSVCPAKWWSETRILDQKSGHLSL